MEKLFMKLLVAMLLIMLSIFVFYMLTFGRTELSDNWRFALNFGFGILIGIIVLFLWKSIKLPLGSNFIGIIGTLFTILSIFGAIDYDTLHLGIDEKYDKNELIDIGKDIYIADTDEIHVLFAFDNTQYNITPEISAKLKEQYDIYLKDIKKHYPDFKNENNVTYRTFFKAKLCADLLSFIDTKGKFSIYIIGNNVNEFFLGEDFNVSTIEEAIIKLSKEPYKDYQETESCYYSFYDKIVSLIQTNEIFKSNEFNQYVLYAYGDFIHDKNITRIFTKGNFQDEIEEIANEQVKLANKSIVQNLYVIPFDIKNKTENRQFILDTTISERKQEYKNIIFADKYQPDSYEKDKHYYRVKYLKDIPVYYSSKDEQCSPKLTFDSNKYYIRITNEGSLRKNQHIRLRPSTGSEFPITTEFQKIPSEEIFILFTGTLPTSESDIFLDIAKKGGIHAIVRLDFKKSLPDFIIWLLPLICLLSGVWLGLFIFKKIKIIKQ